MLLQICWQPDPHYEVCWVTSCAQHSPSGWCFVHWATIVFVVLHFTVVWRLQQDVGTFREENLGLRLVKPHRVHIPPAALKEQTMHIRSILRLQLRYLFQELEVKYDLIYGNGVLPGKVLQDSSQEALSKEETRQPVIERIPKVYPLLEEWQTGFQVSNVGSEGFQRGVGLAHPEFRHFTVEKGFGGALEWRVHHDLTQQSQFDILQGTPYDFDQTVEPLQLLGKHCVHWLVVLHRIKLHDLVDVVLFREVT